MWLIYKMPADEILEVNVPKVIFLLLSDEPKKFIASYHQY